MPRKKVKHPESLPDRLKNDPAHPGKTWQKQSTPEKWEVMRRLAVMHGLVEEEK